MLAIAIIVVFAGLKFLFNTVAEWIHTCTEKKSYEGEERGRVMV